MNEKYPIIDIFAGPGGLAEGFSSFLSGEEHPFQISLSFEKDETAHRTLLLRSFFRSFAVDKIPDEYWSYVRGEITRERLFELYPKNAAKASEEARCVELGRKQHKAVKALIDSKLGAAKKWVLVGGPPCQAYSLVGRSRMKNTDPDFEGDERHFLYREYLRIIADHKPPVFVMENVKGLLSATHSGNPMIERILRDLKNPDRATGRPSTGNHYRLYSLVEKRQHFEYEPQDFVVEAENYGIPQTRHRVFIFGIRGDIDLTPEVLTKSPAPSVANVIGDLPKIRSAISREEDSFSLWQTILNSVQKEIWYKQGRGNGLLPTMVRIDSALEDISKGGFPSTGGEVLDYYCSPSSNKDWYRANCPDIILNHAARSHMRSDLHRYFFASSYATANSKSAQVWDFPVELRPKHKNISNKKKKDYFTDRFRVQLEDKPSTTITSHISKDGHYFIHYDPSQCRSLTVREAARLQTFPDSYKFEGNRTSQYHQVGNAVPPLLSKQIAEIVYDVLKRIKT